MQPWSAYAIIAYVITTLAADVETCQRSLDWNLIDTLGTVVRIQSHLVMLLDWQCSYRLVQRPTPCDGSLGG